MNTAIRQALAQAGEGINNQVGKLTERPTLRWIFQTFQSVHLVIVDGTKQITNLTALSCLREAKLAC